MKSNTEDNPPQPGGPGHETRDADAVSVALAGLLVVLVTALVAMIAAGIFEYASRQPLPADERSLSATSAVTDGRAPMPFPEPRLQVAPEEDLKDFRAREESELNSYGWIDRRASVVRIPIDRAMVLLMEKGLPVRGQPGASPARKTDLQLQQERPLESTAAKLKAGQ